MKSRGTKKITVLLVLALGLLSLYGNNLKAEEWNGESLEYWKNYCSNKENASKQVCRDYNDFLSNKEAESSDLAGNLGEQIKQIEADILNYKNISAQYDAEISALNNTVAKLDAQVSEMEARIIELDGIIIETEKNIEKRTKQIEQRMNDMQASANVNPFIDFIMGAEDLIDLIERASNVESITKYDNEQIKKLDEETKLLEDSKKEQAEKKEAIIVQREEQIAKRQQVEKTQAASDELLMIAETKAQELLSAKNAAEAAAKTAANARPIVIDEGGGGITSPGWTSPIHASVTTPIGAYPGHRGNDYAVGIGTPVYAPADSIVLFAENYHPNNGFLGNNAGTPSGGGNSIRLLFNVGGTTFAMNLHHLSPGSMPALNYYGNGKIVPAGTLIGYTGNSGNSSGAHLHLELFKYHSMTVSQAVAQWNNDHDWQSSAGWGHGTATGSYASRVDSRAYF